MGGSMRYEKLPLSIPDQSKRLSERGLQFDDFQRVEKYLSNIGYYRLSAYWHPFELPTTNVNSRNHSFKPNTSFDQVLDLYIFDRKLRLLVMEAIERIEVAIRTRWATALALRLGSHAHMRSELFKDPWQHAGDLGKIAAELGKSSETFVTHYKKQYKEPFLPPIWAIVETMSLGTLSRWFKNTNDTVAKKEVSTALNMPSIEILEQVLHALTPVRNVCAHHGRLWNRRFAMSLPVIKRIRERLVPPDATYHQDHHLYNFLVVIDVLMKAISPGSTWTQRLMTLVEGLEATKHKSMGFPEDWRERQPWRELA